MATMNDQAMSTTNGTLTVQPRRDEDSALLWPAWQNSHLVKQVTGLDDAMTRARENDLALMIVEAAYRQMVEAGLAPEAPPDDVAIID
jgi:hypothetical protein